MDANDFRHLKQGDRLLHNGEYTHVSTWLEPGYVVELTNGTNLGLDDSWLKDVQIINVAAPTPEPAAANMVRIEVVISGIDINSKAWGFMEEAINDAIGSYGGEVTDWNDTTPR